MAKVNFKMVLYLINLYEQYRKGNKDVTIRMMRDVASSFEVGTLNLKNDGTDKEFIDSMEKSYLAARNYRK